MRLGGATGGGPAAAAGRPHDLEPSLDGVLDPMAFRRRAWIAGVIILLLLMGVRLVMSEMGADRREEAIARDLDQLVATVAWPHGQYLSPRIALAETTMTLLTGEYGMNAETVREVAAVGVRGDPLAGTALLAYRRADRTRTWTVQQDDRDADLATVEARLDASFTANPAPLHALAVDLGAWGRVLVLRFALAGAHAGESLLEVIRLDPLYGDLFVPQVRATSVLQIYDETGLVWGESGEPPASAHVITRSFPSAGQRWTMRAWPRPEWLAAERQREWWAIARMGLPTAPLVAAVAVSLLLWWGRLTRHVVLAEQRTRRIVDQALDAVVSMDARGIITGWNAHAELTFGWSAKEAIGRPLVETLVPPRYRDAHKEGVRRFLAGGVPQLVNRRVEMAAWHRDGREFPVELSINPIRWRDGVSFTAFIRDITERTRAEEELRRAKESAEAANRAKSEFLATMSHEIRTPMNGIFGMTELALDTADDAERRDFLIRARACAESLMTIINDVLDFSKIEAGKLDLECIEFDVRAVLDGVLDTLAIEAARKQLELVGFIDGSLPARLRGDPGRLRQILMNLAGNALKFTEHGEIVIRLTRVETPRVPVTVDARAAVEKPAHPPDAAPAEPAVLVHCSVRDTGIGIAGDKQRSIFESFTQADSSTTRRYGGTGLGLAISQRLVSMMGGTIGVDSEPGQGSTFWFTVPLAAGAPARPSDARTGLAGLRVLVVDDNATNRMFLLRTLQGWGCRPGLASGGTEACDLLTHAAREGEPFDIVLLDMHMPDLDGRATAARMRAEPTTREVPIVALTSVSRNSAERAADIDFAAFLPKPIKQAQLLEVLLSAARPDPRSKGGPVALDPTRRPRILVVDDNEANRIIAETVLRRAGYEVHLACGGREASAATELLAPDLVLMDLEMPDVDGWAATAVIRAAEGTAKRTPIVALTAATGDRERCAAAGMDGYVVKPLRREELLAAVAGALATAVDTRAASPAPAPPTPASEPEPEDELLDRATMAAITARFLDDAVARCEALREAVTAGEADTVQHIGHYIKGGAAQLSMPTVRDLAAALEALGRNGRLEPAVGLVPILAEELENARRLAAAAAPQAAEVS